MFKMIMTMKRRAGMSLDEFIDYYHNNHMPLLGRTLPHSDHGARVSRRNFVRRDDPIFAVIGDDRADANPPFDCLTEIEFDSREDAEETMKEMFDPQVIEKIKQDERNFVDPRSIRFYVVEMDETVMK